MTLNAYPVLAPDTLGDISEVPYQLVVQPSYPSERPG